MNTNSIPVLFLDEGDSLHINPLPYLGPRSRNREHPQHGSASPCRLNFFVLNHGYDQYSH